MSESPHTHVAPGEKCPTCLRRINHPKTSDSPTTKMWSMRIPEDGLDEWEEHFEALANHFGVGTKEKFFKYKVFLLAMGEALASPAQEIYGDSCVRCGKQAVHTHHRKMRSQGGDNSAANLIRLCVDCHNWTHANPEDAYDLGYLVKSWQNPEEVEIGG